jgi:hypothetical protein
MDLYSLATELEQIERERRYRLLEATTMSAISYLPAQIGVVKARLGDLVRKKRKWGLEILEDDDGNKDVRIGNELRILVPKEHWDNFQEMFTGKLTNDSYLDLNVFLNEALEDDLRDLREELKPALFKLFSEKVFNSLDRSIQVWIGRFGITTYLTNRAAIAVPYENKGKQIQKLHGDLLRAYGDDKGGLEMLLSDIQSKRPLGAHDVFKKYDHLYGTRIRSKIEDVTLIFEATVDMAFMISQSIYVDNDSILDNVEEDVVAVKRVGNVLYPEGEVFPVSFFETLQDIIEEIE